jgi:hypothetical protein
MEMALAPDNRLDEGRVNPVTLRCGADRPILASLETALPPPPSKSPSQEDQDQAQPAPFHEALLAYVERRVERQANPPSDFPLPAIAAR